MPPVYFKLCFICWAFLRRPEVRENNFSGDGAAALEQQRGGGEWGGPWRNPRGRVPHPPRAGHSEDGATGVWRLKGLAHPRLTELRRAWRDPAGFYGTGSTRAIPVWRQSDIGEDRGEVTRDACGESPRKAKCPRRRKSAAAGQGSSDAARQFSVDCVLPDEYVRLLSL